MKKIRRMKKTRTNERIGTNKYNKRRNMKEMKEQVKKREKVRLDERRKRM